MVSFLYVHEVETNLLCSKAKTKKNGSRCRCSDSTESNTKEKDHKESVNICMYGSHLKNEKWYRERERVSYEGRILICLKINGLKITTGWN